MNKVWEALGGVKVGMALMVFVVSTVLLCVKFITEDAWTYMATFCVLTAVGGNLVGMGIHAFAKNPQASVETPANPQG
jgi:putative copper export protein